MSGWVAKYSRRGLLVRSKHAESELAADQDFGAARTPGKAKLNMAKPEIIRVKSRFAVTGSSVATPRPVKQMINKPSKNPRQTSM